MTANPKLFLLWFSVILLFLDLKPTECVTFKQLAQGASRMVQNLSTKFISLWRTDDAQLTNRFRDPDSRLQFEENFYFEVLPQAVTDIEKKISLNPSLLHNIREKLKNYDLHEKEQIRSAMVAFNKHLCSILFPRGFDNLRTSMKNQLALMTPNESENEIGDLMRSFWSGFDFMFAVYKEHVGILQYFRHHYIVKFQIHGLIAGNEPMMWLLSKNLNSNEILRNYLGILDANKISDSMVHFFTELMQIFRMKPPERFLESEEIKAFFEDIDKELEPLKKKKQFRDMKEEAVKLLLYIIKYDIKDQLSLEDAEKAFGVFIENPYQSTFLLEYDARRFDEGTSQRQMEVSLGKLKEDEIEVNINEPIKSFMVPIFKTMNKNVSDILRELTDFLERLSLALQLDDMIENVKKWMGNVNTCTSKPQFGIYTIINQKDLIYTSTIKRNIESEMDEISLASVERPENEAKNGSHITYERYELFVFKIFEVRGAFLSVFEYMLYTFEKRLRRAGLLEEVAISIQNVLNSDHSRFALRFLSADNVYLLRNFADEETRNTFSLMKWIAEKLQEDEMNNPTPRTASSSVPTSGPDTGTDPLKTE